MEVGVFSGGSLFMWKNYFGKNSRIIGIDLNPDAKKLENHGFEIFIGNPTKFLEFFVAGSLFFSEKKSIFRKIK